MKWWTQYTRSIKERTKKKDKEQLVTIVITLHQEDNPNHSIKSNMNKEHRQITYDATQ